MKALKVSFSTLIIICVLSGCATLTTPVAGPGEGVTRTFDADFTSITKGLETFLGEAGINITKESEGKDLVVYRGETGTRFQKTSDMWLGLEAGANVLIQIFRVDNERIKVNVIAKSKNPLLPGDPYKAVQTIFDNLRVKIEEEPTLRALENVDVKAAVSPGVTPDELLRVRRVAVVLGEGQNQTGGDLINIMSDNVALELMNLGFQVIERQSMERVLSEQKLQMSGLVDASTAVQIGKMVGVDAVVLGNVTTVQRTEMKQDTKSARSVVTITSVSNATMRVVGVERGNVLMIVTISYKEGQNPAEATKIMALTLSEKLQGSLNK
ncbi:MAG: hypothetical protein HZC11_05975 [Nitrospirae bacterium]|nr:hypothetical protein [Nitrospirota bacterium]